MLRIYIKHVVRLEFIAIFIFCETSLLNVTANLPTDFEKKSNNA